MTKRALITGQDGAYLAELQLARGYEVHDLKRRSSTFNTGRIDHLYQGPPKRRRREVLCDVRTYRTPQPSHLPQH